MKVAFDLDKHGIPQAAAPFPVQANSLGVVRCCDGLFGINMYALDGTPFAHGHYDRDVMRDFAKRILKLTGDE